MSLTALERKRDLILYGEMRGGEWDFKKRDWGKKPTVM